jgi:PAS domain S-box-containing protein/excisionase family DNA binding protein
LDGYLTTQDIALRLGVKVETVRHWVRQGKLQGLSLGRAGYRISEAAYKAFVQKQSSSDGRPDAVAPPFLGPSFLPLLEAITDSFVVLDLEGRYLYLNETACRTLEHTRTELIGQVAWQFFPALVGGPLYHAFQQAVSTGKPVSCEYRSVLTGRWLRTKLYPSNAWVSIYFTDLTEHKEIEDSLASLVAIVDSSQDAIIGKTLEGIITSWNAAACRLYGYEAAEVLGRPITIIIPEEYRAQYAELMNHLRRGERIDSLDTVRRRKDGTLVPVSLTLSPVRNGQGKLIGASTIARDISERVRMEEALVASEQRFRATFEQAAVGIAHVAPDGRFLAVNQRLCDMVGYSHEELLARNFQNITFPEDLETDLTYLHQLLSGERQTYSMEKRYVCRNGSLLWINLTVSLVHEEPGTPRYFIAVIEDISKRKRLEHMRDEFLAMASHELRTPLTGLKGFSALLSRRLANTSDEQSLTYLTRMNAQIARLSRLVEDLLDLSRIQLNQFSLVKEQLDLAALVRETAEMAQATTPKNLQLLEADQGAIMLVEGDRARLIQVIYTLLDNAIKYSPGADLVVIRLSTKDSHAVVQIQDFGIGIDPQYHQQIFERFFQVPDPVAKTFPGMGIGLYLALDIVRRHQGSITLESCPGEGSTFTLMLPLVSSERLLATEQKERSEFQHEYLTTDDSGS